MIIMETKKQNQQPKSRRPSPSNNLFKNKALKLIAVILSLLVVVACFNISDSRLSHSFKDNILSLKKANRSIQLSALATGAIQVEFLQESEAQLTSFAIKDDLKNLPAQFKLTDSSYQFSSGKLRAVIDKVDLSIAFYRENQLLTIQKQNWLLRQSEQSQQANSSKAKLSKANFSKVEFSLDKDEKIMGGGQRVLGMDRRGHRLPLYNRAHYGYTTESNQMYYSLPLVISDRKYSILFDNTASGFLDIGKTKADQLVFEAESGRKAYIVFADDSYQKLINQYVNVTGTQPMPPRWAFGNFSSRFGYKNQQQVISTIEQFIQDDMPVDAIILDLYWFGNDIKGFMGNLAWDKQAFPDPEKMISDLKSKGVKTILVTEPFILSTSTRWDEAVTEKILMKDQQGQPKRFDFYFGNTGLIDIFDDQATEWFSGIYSGLTQQGVAGVWGDLGEPEVHPDDGVHFVSGMQQSYDAKTLHNAYGHQWAKMVYQNLITDRPDRRPFVMMRSGFAGTQRYGMIPWTGDVSRSWGGLKPQVELTLQMGMQGLAYTHSDLGGFAGGESFDKELYIRWLQYGVFQPVFRPHAQDNIAPEPIFHDQQTKDIIREYLKLRYSMLPYIYSMAYQNSRSGLPLMRPVMFSDTDNPFAFDIKDRYFWGDSLLVAPVVDAGVTEAQVELPDGVWFDFWNDIKYQGNQIANIPTSLETIPVMVKAGAFIPMIDPINNTSDYSSQKLNLHYYYDETLEKSQYQMYEDDGITPNNIENNHYELLDFIATNKNNQLVIELNRTATGYQSMPSQRQMNLIIHGVSRAPNNVRIGGERLESADYSYDDTKQQLRVNFLWDHQLTEVIVKL
jgi:oligosaccharide 4-alpha-D-glucosyltransferase